MRDFYEFKYQLTYDDFRKTAGLGLTASNTMRFLTINNFLSFFAIGFIVAIGLIFVPFEIPIYIYIILGFFSGWLYQYIYARLIMKEYATLPALQKETLYRFTSSTFYEEVDGFTTIIPYKYLTLVENKHYFALFHNIMILSPIPKSLFQDEEEIQQFRAFLVKYILETHTPKDFTKSIW